MDVDKIISHLAGKVTEAEFRERVRKKIEEFGGLLTSEGATLIVASELGVPVEAGRLDSSDISALEEGLASVNVIGMISDIFPTREFVRNNSSGKVASVTLTDMTGSIRTVFWNDDTEKVRDMKRGGLLEILGGYVKRGLYGLELHVGRRGRIITNPTCEKEFPPLDSGQKKIRGLAPAGDLATGGVVVRTFPVREFKKEDNAGRVSSLILRDETGEIRVSLWQEKADLVTTLQPGDVVRIEGAYAKQGLNGLELHIGTRGTLTRTDEKMEVSLEETPSSTFVAPNGIDITGTIESLGGIRGFTRPDGSAGSVCSFTLRTEDRETRMVFWNDHCRQVPFLKEGMVISVTNAYPKEGMNGEELHVSSQSRVALAGAPSQKKVVQRIGPCEIVARVSSCDPATITDESGACEIECEGTFEEGDLVRVRGEFKDGRIIADSVERIATPFFTLEELRDPPHKSLADCHDGELVLVSGLLKRKHALSDHYVYLIDDGEEEMSGVGHENLAVGKEYIFKMTIHGKETRQFVSHASFEVADTEALRRMVERIGEMIEV